jgi:hypothetical protein
MTQFKRRFFAILIGFLILLNGCGTTVSNLNKKDNEAIAGGGKSVVLLRLSAEIDTKRTEGPERFKAKIASIDTGQSPKDISHYDFPSAEAQKDGWVYFMLEPGTYYFGVSPKLDTWKDYNYFYHNYFWFHVPQGNQVIYIGTLSAACETKSGFFSQQVDHCFEVQVIDQTESAQAIAQASFSRFAPMSSAILKPLGTPRTTRAVDELVPMGFMTNSAKSPIPPEYKGRYIKSANRMVWRAVSGDWEGDGSGDPYGALLYAFFSPALITLASGGGAIAGEVAEHKWQPTTQGLQQELQKNDPAILLGSVFETMLSRYGASRPINLNQVDDPFGQAKQQGLKSIFQTEILKIELSECGLIGTFGVAITLRTRLWETASNNLLYDSVTRYYNAAISKKPLFYETELGGDCPECRKKEDYSGAEGGKLLNEVISKAIQASMQRFFNDVVKEKSQ